MRVPLTMALSGYHHTAALASGLVGVEGADVQVLTLPVEEIFFRFTKFREWHVSEMSLGKYVALRSRGDDSLVGIPVFPSRMFRHSSMYVRSDGVSTPEQLKGGRIGVPEWAQTAAVYSRGLLTHEYGVPLQSVTWVQAGVNDRGRSEKVQVDLPDGVNLERTPERSLDEMLCAGDLDAILTAHPPASFEAGDGRTRRLFPDVEAVEREYAARTRIFPIMHLIVIRADVFEQHPWLAPNLMTAFERAKQISLGQLAEVTASRVPIPWMAGHLTSAHELLFGDAYWPYGIEPNRPTLELFANLAFEQGVAGQVTRPGDLFPDSVASRFNV